MGNKYFATGADQKALTRFHQQQQRKQQAAGTGKSPRAAAKPASPPAQDAPAGARRTGGKRS